MAEIDNLEIKISASAEKASSELDKLINKLGSVSTKLSGIDSNSKMKLDLTISGGATKTVDNYARYLDKKASEMAETLQGMFNVSPRYFDGIKYHINEVVKLFNGNYSDDDIFTVAQMKSHDLYGYLKRVTNSANDADSELKDFYETLCKVQKIYINPIDVPTDWHDTNMDGLLRQKFTTDASAAAEKLDVLMNSEGGWAEQFPNLFGGLGSVQDQFEALVGFMQNYRGEVEGAERETGELASYLKTVVGIANDSQGEMTVLEQFDKLWNSIEKGQKFFDETGTKVTDTSTGFKDLATSLRTISNIDGDKLTTVGESVRTLAEGLKTLNDVRVDVTAFKQLTEAARELNKMPTVTSNTMDAMGKAVQALSALNGVKIEGLGTVVDQLSQLSSGLKAMEKSGGAITSMQTLEERTAELQERFKDLGKDYSFTGSLEQLRKRADSLSNALESAKVDAQELAAKGKFNTEGYSDAIAKVQRYKNELAAVQEQLNMPLTSDSQVDPLIHLMDGRTMKLSELESEENAATQSSEQMGEAVQNAAAQMSASMSSTVKDSSAAQEALKRVEEETDKVSSKFKDIPPLSVDNSTPFALEKSINGLYEDLDRTQKKIAEFNAQGVNPDTQKVQRLQMHIEQIYQALDKYEGKLKEARANGELDINVAPITEGLSKAAQSAAAFNEKMQSSVVNKPTKEMQALQSELAKIEKKYQQTTDYINQKAKTTQYYGTTADYQKQMANLESLRQKYQSVLESMGQLGKSGYKLDMSGVTSALSGVKKALAGIPAAAKSAASHLAKVGSAMGVLITMPKRVVSGLKSIKNHLLALITPSKKAGNSIMGMATKSNIAAKAFSKMGNMLKLMIMRGAMRSIYNNLGDAIGVLAKYSSSFNDQVSELIAGCKQLAYNIVAVAEPLLDVFGPALNTVIDLLNSAVESVNQFISALSGKSYYTKAVKVVESYADSLDDASESASNANKSLQSFHELNNITTSSSSSDSDSDSGTYYTTVEIDSDIASLAERIREALASDNWSEIGAAIADGLNTALDSISWDNIQAKAASIARKIATLINGFVGDDESGTGADWALVGTTIGEGINTALTFADTFVNTLKWGNLGTALTTTIYNALDTIDWDTAFSAATGFGTGLADFLNGLITEDTFSELGTTIANALNTAIYTSLSFSDELDWMKIGTSLATGISDFFKTLDGESLGKIISSSLSGLLDLGTGFLLNFDSDAVVNTMLDTINGIDFSKIGMSLSNLMGALLGGTYNEETGKVELTVQDVLDNLGDLLGAAELAIGAVLTFSGASIPVGLGLMAAGLVTYAIGEDWDKVSDKVKDTIAVIALAVGAAELAIGAVLAFSGVKVGLGIGLMAAGAATMVSVQLNWNNLSQKVKDKIALVTSTVSTALLAIGAIVAFSGVNIPLGISLMAAGAIGLATTVGLNWNTLSQSTKDAISIITAVLSTAFLTIGAVLAFSGASLPIGIGLMLVGAAGLATAAALNWNTIVTAVKNTMADIGVDLGLNLLALGAILALSGVALPLGIALMAAGGISLASGIALNWDTITSKISGVWDDVKTVTSNAWDTIKTTVSDAWDGIVTKVSTVVTIGFELMESLGIDKWLYKNILIPWSEFWSKYPNIASVLGVKYVSGDSLETLKGYVSSDFSSLSDYMDSLQGRTGGYLGDASETTNVTLDVSARVIDFSVADGVTVDTGVTASSVTPKSGVSMAVDTKAKTVSSNNQTMSVATKASSVAAKSGVTLSVGTTASSVKPKSGVSLAVDTKASSVSSNGKTMSTAMKASSLSSNSKTLSTTMKATSLLNGSKTLSTPMKASSLSSNGKTLSAAMKASSLSTTATLKNIKATVKELTKSSDFTGITISGTTTATTKNNTTTISLKLEKSGGILKNGSWRNIPQYASGTLNAGSLFAAGESGPEVVGHINGQTEVLNQSQIAAAMKASVLGGLAELIPSLQSIYSQLTNCANGIIEAQFIGMDAIASAVDGITGTDYTQSAVEQSNAQTEAYMRSFATEFIPYLKEIASNTRDTADGVRDGVDVNLEVESDPNGIFKSVRQSSKEYYRRTGRGAFTY